MRIASFTTPWLLLLAYAASAPADESRAVKFLGQLQRLGLFDLAEKYARERLARVAPEDEAELVIELVRTQTLKAMNQGSREAEGLWNEARQSASKYLARSPRPPKFWSVALQDGLTLQARGEQLRDEASLQADGEPLLVDARKWLRQSDRDLTKLASEVEREIPLRRASKKPGDYSVEELVRLLAQVQYRIARVKRSQALCFLSDSPDRKALLLAALEEAQTAAEQLAAGDRLAVQIGILQTTLLRETNQTAEAGELIATLDREDLPADLSRLLLAEWVRVQLKLGQPEAVRQRLAADPMQALGENAEFDLARLEFFLGEMKAASEESAKQKLSATIATLTQRLEASHGLAWKRRANELLAGLAGSGAGTSSGSLLARQAEVELARGRLADARRLFDQAAELAERESTEADAATWRLKAAQIDAQLQQFSLAAERLEAFATRTSSSRAAELHLLACWYWAQQTRLNPESSKEYERALLEHVERWPRHESTSQARAWLAQWRVKQQRWSDVLPLVVGVTPASSSAPTAIQLALVAGREELTSTKLASGDRELLARRYSEFFRSCLPAEKNDPTWSTTSRAALLALAEISVRFIPVKQQHIAAQLRQALTGQPPADASFQESALLCLVVIDGAEADGRALKTLASKEFSSTSLLLLLERLQEQMERANAEGQTRLAQLQLAVLDRCDAAAKAFSPEQLQQLKRRRAIALTQAGQRDDARRLWQEVCDAEPNRGEWQQEYAEFLEAGNERDAKLALDRWRVIAARSKPRESRWYRAKYGVATMLARVGQSQEATQLVRYLLETPPGITDATWKTRFASLQAELANK